MSEEYALIRDIVYDHNERMLNIKKYYPFFKLSELSFQQYKEGKYEMLDMGYILMAVLRFFIEENNFCEKMVTYEAYANFMHGLYLRDFELKLSEPEEKELTSYIFDKLKNDGKPFSLDYFDPVTKKKKTIRTKIINDKILEDTVVYSITSDAIEFYLDTKEIKDESNITIAQVLLSKMIASKNFKGGTEVIARINNEVSKLISKKNEILNILSYDVFQGLKAYEDFVQNTVKWFEDEQKLFEKNKELIEKALRTAENDDKYFEAMEDIYRLESELNKAMQKHGELLAACTNLQSKTDEIVANAKFSRLRSSLDFRRVLSNIMDADRADLLALYTKPLLKLALHKSFSLTILDNMLTYKTEEGEIGEKIQNREYNEDFQYEDEKEEERIKENYDVFITVLFEQMLEQEEFDLKDYNNRLREKIKDKNVLKNADYYSFFVHLCQKTHYDMDQVLKKSDTFLEDIMKGFLADQEKYRYLSFDLEFDQCDKTLDLSGNEVVNIKFRRR